MSSVRSCTSLVEETCQGYSESYTTYVEKHPGAIVIGANGAWYDITAFVPKHPGGEFIARFNGRDVTEMVKVFHDRDVLKGHKPVGFYKPVISDPVAKVFEELRCQLMTEGFWRTNYLWYAMKMVIPFFILLACGTVAWHVGVRAKNGAAIGSFTMVVELVLAGAILGNFWQQCGFLMHDLMHNECFHNRIYDQFLGVFFGTVCTGIDSSWWRDEHFEHHVFTNVFNESPLYYDPQMREDVWIQDDMLKPSFHRQSTVLHVIQWILFKLQHITWAPICMLVGRVAIVIDGLRQERRQYEWVAAAIHWTWMIAALYSLLPLKGALILYGTASVYEGVLHLQLVVSHYCKPWTQLREVATDLDWFRMQIACSLNIKNPYYTDWFHGGLNFHIEHHLFPTMPRHNLRAASVHVRKACDQVGILYDECTLFEAICRTISHLRELGKRQSLVWDNKKNM